MPKSTIASKLIPSATLALALLSGCAQADYSADVRNNTPQPVFAQLFVRSNDNTSQTLASNKRLGPGDRAFLGPVRTADRHGAAYLVLDTLPNSSTPLFHDLKPGANHIDVAQQTETAPPTLRISTRP